MNQSSLSTMYPHIEDAGFPAHLVRPFVQLIWDEIARLETVKQAGDQAATQLTQLQNMLDDLATEDVPILPFARTIEIEPVYAKAFGPVAVDVRMVSDGEGEDVISYLRIAVRAGSVNEYQDYAVIPAETEIAMIYDWIARLAPDQAAMMWEWLLPIVYKIKESEEYLYP